MAIMTLIGNSVVSVATLFGVLLVLVAIAAICIDELVHINRDIKKLKRLRSNDRLATEKRDRQKKAFRKWAAINKIIRHRA